MARKRNDWRSRTSYEQQGESNRATQIARNREMQNLTNAMVRQQEGSPYGMSTNYTPEQQAVLSQFLTSGPQKINEAMRQYEELTHAKTPQERSLNELQALSSVAATPGSYGGALGQLAGGFLGGPAGSAVGGALGSIGGSLFDRWQASQAFGPYEQAARRNFERETIPGIAERFAGANALNSGAFQNALGQSAADLESQLAMAKANYSAQQMDQLMKQRALANEELGQMSERERLGRAERAGYLSALENRGLGELQLGLSPIWSHIYQEQAAPWWQQLLSPIAQGVGYGVGGPIGGAISGGLNAIGGFFGGQQAQRQPMQSRSPLATLIAFNKLQRR